MKGGLVTCKGCGQRLRIRGGDREKKEAGQELEIDFAPLAAIVKEAVAEAVGQVDIELPDLTPRLDALEASLKELKEAVELKVEDAAGAMVDEASPATRSRLALRWRTKEQEPPPTPSAIGTGIKDQDGIEYGSLSDQFHGEVA